MREIAGYAVLALILGVIAYFSRRRLEARITAIEKQDARVTAEIERTRELCTDLALKPQGWMPAIKAAIDVAPHIAELREAAAKLREFTKTY
jgi:hypothetical protein